ncbi:vasoactive intestinal polypeptide receptor 2-like [Hippoglossus hippoglossus]|uniref:vasoactive intestinal polypeptide receptor 2-like n=1 Tax=Hippoglossus hippoglossus TaxID=8267 RepID=UPI00148D3ABB|nr:vasoactive intestinal polypeptide receptor 2-like [Hippoglossus hippoglossus]
MSFTHRLVLLLLGLSLVLTVEGKFPNCQFHWEIQRAETECRTQLQQQQAASSTGCHGQWYKVACWQSAAFGEVMTLPCPSALIHVFGKNGNLSRNCTERGWSDVYPIIFVACGSNSDEDDPSELVFYRMVRILSTLGHSLSLITLLTSTVIICLFRRLHCMRNYIHLNLFVSFMLRAVAVLAKDALLFSDDENTDCSTQPSLVGCKSSLVFFNYFIMANFFWLLVEGLYLHTLLLVIHTYSTPLSVYMLIGWGIPFVFMMAWIVCRVTLEDTRCWEMNENPIPNRLMNWPIMASVIINFVLFISIIRILVQKLRCTDVGGNEQSQYRRLAKSTLLLIPLFGMNYMVFVYLMEPPNKNMNRIKIFFDLGLGSFQGLIVAVLYCFLNSEVQSELRRTWRGLSLKGCVGRDYRPHAASVGRNGTESSAQFPRSSRAPSILQTETTVL